MCPYALSSVFSPFLHFILPSSFIYFLFCPHHCFVLPSQSLVSFLFALFPFSLLIAVTSAQFLYEVKTTRCKELRMNRDVRTMLACQKWMREIGEDCWC
jgi:hypothetical protein